MAETNNSPESISSLPGRAPRHDGWTPERMATSLEVFADIGLVAEGARAKNAFVTTNIREHSGSRLSANHDRLRLPARP